MQFFLYNFPDNQLTQFRVFVGWYRIFNIVLQRMDIPDKYTDNRD